MSNHTDWLARSIDVTTSRGGVRAVKNPWDGVLRGDVSPWPPPELIQKAYQSRQARAFLDAERAIATEALGYYCDIQSLHSEDAVTWSLFGPLAYADARVRDSFAADLIGACVETSVAVTPAHIWLWRRLPHPDTLVPGGPEIDFGVQTTQTLVLGEAKWRSTVGHGQGADKTKDQLQLRVEFCEKYGHRLFPEVEQFIVLFVSPVAGSLSEAQRSLSTERIRVVERTWRQLGACRSNPWADEFLKHLEWRQRLSGPV